MTQAEEIARGLTKAQRAMLPTITVRAFPPLGYAVMWTTGSFATAKRLRAKGLVDGRGLTDLGREVARCIEEEMG